jgi:thiamine biosynthesis protein ThiI
VVLILIRYGEMALKSNRTRVRFSKNLVQNIEEAFVQKGLECIIDEQRGRIFLETAEISGARSILRDMFGIVSFSEVVKVKAERDVVSDAAVELLRDREVENATFAVRCRRKGSHKFTSQEMAAWVGEDILNEYKDQAMKVNLSDPRLVVEVEIREGNAYVFLDRIDGPGGFPLGSQGTMTGLVEEEDLNDPKSLLVAFYLMMKRGCRLVLNCAFEESTNKEQLNEVLGILKRYDPKIRLIYKPDLLRNSIEVQSMEGDGVTAMVSGRGLERGLLISEVPVFYPSMGLNSFMLDGFYSRVLN